MCFTIFLVCFSLCREYHEHRDPEKQRHRSGKRNHSRRNNNQIVDDFHAGDYIENPNNNHHPRHHPDGEFHGNPYIENPNGVHIHRNRMREDASCGRCGKNARCQDGTCVCKAGYEGDGLLCEKIGGKFFTFFFSEITSKKNVILYLLLVIVILAVTYYIFEVCTGNKNSKRTYFERGTHKSLPITLNKRINIKEEKESGFDVRFEPVSSKT